MKESTTLTVVLPTYNESTNVLPIVDAIYQVLEGHVDSYEILFVDDSSDNTPDVIAQKQKTAPFVRLIHRDKKERTGLATALALGMKSANGKYICCMDSDLQHPPEVIRPLLQKMIRDNADIAVASRYINGASAEGLGGVYRKFASHVCRYSAWAVLPPVRKSTDPGSGFYIVTSDFLHNLSFGSLYGYKVLIDILARSGDATVVEQPYRFLRREHEESKSTLKQGVLFYKHIFSLVIERVFDRHGEELVTRES